MSHKDGTDQDDEEEAGGSESGGTDSSSGSRAPLAPIRAKPKALDNAGATVRRGLGKRPISIATIRHPFTGFRIQVRRQGTTILDYVVCSEDRRGGQLFSAVSLTEIFEFLERHINGGFNEPQNITAANSGSAADALRPTDCKIAEPEDFSPSSPGPQGSNRRP